MLLIPHPVVGSKCGEEAAEPPRLGPNWLIARIFISALLLLHITCRAAAVPCFLLKSPLQTLHPVLPLPSLNPSISLVGAERILISLFVIRIIQNYNG